jgi:hypothetical protein
MANESDSTGGQGESAWDTKTVVLAPADGARRAPEEERAAPDQGGDAARRSGVGTAAGIVVGGVAAGAAVVAGAALAQDAAALPDSPSAPREAAPGTEALKSGARAAAQVKATANDMSTTPGPEADGQEADADSQEWVSDEEDADDLGDDSDSNRIAEYIEEEALDEEAAEAEEQHDVATHQDNALELASPEPAVSEAGVSRASAEAGFDGEGGATEISVSVLEDGTVLVAGSSEGDATPVRVSLQGAADGSTGVGVIDSDGDAGAYALLVSSAEGTDVELGVAGDAQGASASVRTDGAQGRGAIGAGNALGSGASGGGVVEGELQAEVHVNDIVEICGSATAEAGHVAGAAVSDDILGEEAPPAQVVAVMQTTVGHDTPAFDDVPGETRERPELDGGEADAREVGRAGNTMLTSPEQASGGEDDLSTSSEESPEDVPAQAAPDIAAGDTLVGGFPSEPESVDQSNVFGEFSVPSVAAATPGAHEEEQEPGLGTLSFDASARAVSGFPRGPASAVSVPMLAEVTPGAQEEEPEPPLGTLSFEASARAVSGFPRGPASAVSVPTVTEATPSAQEEEPEPPLGTLSFEASARAVSGFPRDPANAVSVPALVEVAPVEVDEDDWLGREIAPEFVSHHQQVAGHEEIIRNLESGLDGLLIDGPPVAHEMEQVPNLGTISFAGPDDSGSDT